MNGLLQEFLTMLVLFIGFQHFVFAFYLSVPQLLYYFDIASWKFIKGNISVMVLVYCNKDFFPELDCLFIIKAVVHKVGEDFFLVNVTIVISVQYLKFCNQLLLFWFVEFLLTFVLFSWLKMLRFVFNVLFFFLILFLGYLFEILAHELRFLWELDSFGCSRVKICVVNIQIIEIHFYWIN